MPHAFETLVGKIISDKVFDWWNDLFAEGDTPTGWVSFAQLYILFQMHSKHIGVIRSGRGWLNPNDQPGCVPERFSFKVRLKWFRLVIQKFWRLTGFRIGTACTRPRSSMISCHVGCASIPLADEKIQIIDDWLRERLPAPITGQGKDLNKVPLAFV